MAARPSWEGHLRLSLVTCPVALWPATTEAETVRFNLINPKTNNRIRMQTLDAGTGEEVSRGDLVKGFQIAKGEYVLFDKEELDAVKLESTRIIDIEKFVPRASIDRLYWDTPYHLVPSGKTGIEAYAVIRAAMAKQNMVAIGRLVMSTRERICAIEIEEGGLVLTTLRTAEEVRASTRWRCPSCRSPTRNAADCREDRRAAVGRLRSQRVPRPLRGRLARPDRGQAQGQAGKAAEAGERRHKVVDLMAALKKSLESGGGAARARRALRRRQGQAPQEPAAARGRPDMVELGHELEKAMRDVVVARDRLNAASPEAPEYQSTLIDYLQATVHHLAVLAVAQARQYEDIAEEVAELRARVAACTDGALMGSQHPLPASPAAHFREPYRCKGPAGAAAG